MSLGVDSFEGVFCLAREFGDGSDFVADEFDGDVEALQFCSAVYARAFALAWVL